MLFQVAFARLSARQSFMNDSRCLSQYSTGSYTSTLGGFRPESGNKNGIAVRKFIY
jgi:hypothetical protein